MLHHLLLCLIGFLPARGDLVVFDDPAFPALDVQTPLPHIDAATSATDLDALRAALGRGDTLVWRHGSAFPADLWSDFVAFLERGGSFLYLGGEPFTRPVVRAGERFVAQPRTLALLKALRLNQCQRSAAGNAVRHYRDDLAAGRVADRIVPADAWVAILEPRLTDGKDFDHEDGAPGSREAVLRPLALLHLPGDDARFPAAAASFAIDRLYDRFAGGRWVFHLLSTPPAADALAVLLAEATREAAELRVDPTLGCYHAGERAAVLLRAHRPGASDSTTWSVDLTVTGPDGVRSGILGVPLAFTRHAAIEVPLAASEQPGLYRVEARCAGREPVTTGFWRFDEALFCSGGPLTFDDYTLRRGDEPIAVIGTTVMSRGVQRKFLFEPNAQEWDDTFAEMAAVGMNVTRTGIWSGWRKIALDPGVIDEAFLRALEAYYLSARRHGITVLFTPFAFVPEDWGFANPYLDPRAIDAQRAFVGAIAGRFSKAQEWLFDLINEPSFSSPDKLWQCRPNGDRFEQRAFTAWLAQRFGGAADGRSWQDVVRARWRLLPDAPIGLPEDDDFVDRNLFGDHHPYRAQDYVLFAQHAFRGWMEQMIAAIRDAGSDAPITVGQDEGGLLERPGPLFHDDLVAFTSMHTWWFNDALLADGLLAKAPGKPLLVSETGIMQRELLSGESLRTPAECAALLERKIAYAFMAGAFGVIEWCQDVNPYLASDNEVAIGLRRVDGSYKPEHAVLRRCAAFLRRNQRYLQHPVPPTTALVVPASEHWGPRSLKLAGVRRLIATHGADLQVVDEYRTGAHLGAPRTMILPACRGLSDGAWQDIRRAVLAGATLACSGWFEADDAGLPATRLGLTARPLRRDELQGSLPLDLSQSWFAAEDDVAPHLAGLVDASRIHHDPVPMEWAATAGSAAPADGMRRITMGHGKADSVDFVLVVNEASRPRQYAELGTPPMTVPAGGAVLAIVAHDGRRLDSSQATDH